MKTFFALEALQLHSRTAPDHPVVEATAHSLTRSGLIGLIDSMAAGMAPSVGPGSRVGIPMGASAEYIICFMALQKVGAIAVPLDPNTPAERLRNALDVLSLDAILTDPASPVPAAFLDEVHRENITHLVTDVAPGGTVATRVLAPDDPRYILVTSGSTGAPKPVYGSAAGLEHFVHWEVDEFGVREDDRVSFLAPPTFDVSLRDILTPVVAGGTICIPPPDVRADPAGLLAWLESAAITHVHCVPSLFRELIAAMGPRRARRLPRLRRVMLAGEPLLASDVISWREHTDSPAEIVNLYGPSETTLAKFFYRVEEELPVTPNGTIPVGSPIPDTVAELIRDGKPCASGTIGEIWIGPPFDGFGYASPVKSDRETVVAGLSYPERRGFLTGDQAVFSPDHGYVFLGRLDDQVKVNGVRIELGDIETQLRRVPGVRNAAAAGIRNGSEARILVGYYTGDVAPAEVSASLADLLPPAMLPSFVVRLTALPLNLHGKVDRRALPRPEALLFPEDDFVAPEGEAEVRLAEIWQKALKLVKVPADRTFLELGGTSLDAARLIRRLYEDFGVEVTLRTILQKGTVRALAAWISEQEDETA